MSINDIKLSDAILTEMYSNSLISLAEINSTDIEKGDSTNKSMVSSINDVNDSIKALGNNSKKILIIVQYPEISYLPDNDLKFLNGILGACKLSLNDVAILNISNYSEIGYKQLIPHFSPKVALLFGVSPVSIGLPLNFPEFQIQAFGGTSYLLSPSLHGMEEDKETKSRLWTSLKRLFNI